MTTAAENNTLKAKLIDYAKRATGYGFILLFVAAVFSVISLCLFLSTYKVGGYTVNRYSVTFTVFAMWILIFLGVVKLIHGDKPFWTAILYAAAVFFLVYAVLLLIQPCLSPIGFVFGAGDLNMGDSALNAVVAHKSIATAVFYVLTAVLTIVAAFLPSGLSVCGTVEYFKRKSNGADRRCVSTDDRGDREELK